jgi:outer membrane lipoprotein
MRKLLFVGLVLLLLSSCATVLKKDLMETGIRDFSLEDLTRNPEASKGKSYILGGMIAGATVTGAGFLIDAQYVPVDSAGYLKEQPPDGRFFALYPKEMGTLDPALYSTGRQITLAGIFIGTQSGKIGQMDYLLPLFRIEQIFLWPKPQLYPSYYWDPYWGPWWGPSWLPYGYPPYGYPYY